METIFAMCVFEHGRRRDRYLRVGNGTFGTLNAMLKKNCSGMVMAMKRATASDWELSVAMADVLRAMPSSRRCGEASAHLERENVRVFAP
jgi:hypothetical protein